MNSLSFWSLVAIFCQTIISIIISRLTLGCKLAPVSSELHEVTLMKLLYLYDPEACGRVYFYNYTVARSNYVYSTIVWPVKNDIAADFRSKIKLWLSLHLIWTFLWFLYMSQGTRPCGYYAVLIPFTVTGLALLVTDLVYSITFLMNAKSINTEAAILTHINSNSDNLKTINDEIYLLEHGQQTDTSWISVLMAYLSIRGVVQWIFNFWIVKDNYFEGLQFYRNLGEKGNMKRKVTTSYNKRSLTY